MSNCKTIAICNQKGGVGKTTTTVNLGVGLAMQGKKVLPIDADPQGDLTTCLGWRDTDNLGITLATKLTDVISETMNDPTDGILHHEEGVDLLPANLELSAMEYNLMNAMSRETTLRNYLSQVKDRYNFVLIDCMPSLSMVTLNALSAADSVIIPVQAQYLPAKGMTQLVQTISKVRKCDISFLSSAVPPVLKYFPDYLNIFFCIGRYKYMYALKCCFDTLCIFGFHFVWLHRQLNEFDSTLFTEMFL